MDMLLKLTDIMRNAGLNPEEVKLARHPLSHKDVAYCVEHNLLDWYQCEQHRDVFSNFKYVLTFLGTKGTTARFIGCYRVGERIRKCKDIKFPQDYPFTPLPENYFYDLQQTDIMSEYVDRLIIDWGKAAQKWD